MAPWTRNASQTGRRATYRPLVSIGRRELDTCRRRPRAAIGERDELDGVPATIFVTASDDTRFRSIGAPIRWWPPSGPLLSLVALLPLGRAVAVHNVPVATPCPP